MIDRSVWRRVILSIEDAIPLYDEVNEIISLNRASLARTYAATKLLENLRPHLILDSGAGPGNISLIVLKLNKETDVVSLDCSTFLLKTCKERLKNHRHRIDLVRGCFEELPFKSNAFDAAITAYALRDSLAPSRAINEYSRSLKHGGRLAIVELAKPDNAVKRFFAVLYVRYIMPLIAKVIVSRRLGGNPWQMIAPTYQNLPTTTKLLRMLEPRFQMVEKRDFLAGGILVVMLRSRPLG